MYRARDRQETDYSFYEAETIDELIKKIFTKCPNTCLEDFEFIKFEELSSEELEKVAAVYKIERQRFWDCEKNVGSLRQDLIKLRTIYNQLCSAMKIFKDCGITVTEEMTNTQIDLAKQIEVLREAIVKAEYK